MECPQCHETQTRVIESRDLSGGQSIRRRRQCQECTNRFTTYERIERPHLVIIKKDNGRQLYDRRKLLAGLTRACEKRPITNVQLEELVSEIERELYASGEAEVSSSQLGELIMDKLRNLDDVAYVRFASVYRSFTDIDSFERELKKIKAKK